ncbi:MAG TPA: fibronectin type III domain-containing protein [Clostridiales bacterium]|nr:fibronectin type III domain-containing protein [Clostridiales bacterium]
MFYGRKICRSVFISLFVIMVVFTAFPRIAYSYDPGFVAFPLSPDTDTKIKLQWDSVPGAKIYRIYRDDGSRSGFVLIREIDVSQVLDPTSYTDQGLKPETTYRYRLEAYDENMGTLLTGDKTAVAVTTAMIRPYGLKAVFDVNSRKAILTWNSSALAEGSRINRYESGVSTYRDTAETASTEELILGAGSVRFTIQTISSGYGMSGPSDTVTVVPVEPPMLSAEYVNEGTVKISWNRQTNIDKFVLECSKWDGTYWGPWETIGTTLSGNYMTHTINEGGKYRYRLKAREDKGYRGYSNITEYVSSLAAPTDLKGRITAADCIELSWTNPPGNEGNIQVWRKAEGGGTSGQYAHVATLPGTADTFSDRFSIQRGVTYHYRINAADDAGHYSSYATISITAKVPDAPAGLRANVVSGSGVILLWDDKSNNEINFIIERYDDVQKKYVTIGTVGADTTTYTDSTAVQGSTYIYRVFAYNGMGRSSSSNEVTISAWDTAAPASLTVTPVSSTRLDLSWSYTGSENYNTIIERKKGADGAWTPIFTTAAGVLKYSDTGLEPNTRYFYRVRKALGTGVSGEPFPDESGVGAYTLLPTPTITARPSSGNSIYITWSGVSDADVVIERKMPSGNFSPIMTVGPSVQGWYDNTGLLPGAFYTYRIMAKNSVNRSLYSSELTVHNYYLEPPTQLSISIMKNSEIVLQWRDNSTDEAGFEIWRNTYGSGQYVLYATVDKNVTTFTDKNVEKGVQYSYKVRAFTQGGHTYSEFSGVASSGIGIINPPADLTYDYISEFQIQLRWTDTSNNEHGFIVEQKIGDDGGWTQIAWVSANNTKYIVSNLNKYTKYYFRVRAYNYAGNVDSVSEEILVSTALPAAPTDLTATTISASQIKLKWTDNSDSEKGFRILRSLYSDRYFYPVAEVGRDTTEYYDSGLNAGTRYYYKVEAFNDVGRSESKVADARTNTRVYFSDIGNVPWAKDAIENLAGLGVVKGVAGTQFMPNNTVTRAEFAAMIVRAFKLETAPVGSLADVRYDKWYYREVMIAENFGIISGDANNRFYPERPITREEIAVMVFRALQASGRKFNVHDNSVLEKFIDRNNISPGAVSSMAVLVGEGIMEGLQGNTIGPKYNATRAQAAVFIYRALTMTEPGEAR